jgi:hypothetical protein
VAQRRIAQAMSTCGIPSPDADCNPIATTAYNRRYGLNVDLPTTPVLVTFRYPLVRVGTWLVGFRSLWARARGFKSSHPHNGLSMVLLTA